jgi:hypothetical protein
MLLRRCSQGPTRDADCTESLEFFGGDSFEDPSIVRGDGGHSVNLLVAGKKGNHRKSRALIASAASGLTNWREN